MDHQVSAATDQLSGGAGRRHSRRRFLGAAAGVAAMAGAFPHVPAAAQIGSPKRVGVLWSHHHTNVPLMAAFLDGMKDPNLTPALAVAVDYTEAHGNFTLESVIAAALPLMLPEEPIDVILAGDSLAVHAARIARFRAGNPSRPIVAAISGDPVGEGHHAAANIYGLTNSSVVNSSTRLNHFLRILGVSRVGVLYFVDSPSAQLQRDETIRSAPRGGARGRVDIIPMPVVDVSSFGQILTTPAEAIVVMSDPVTSSYRETIIHLGWQHLPKSIPTVFGIREAVEPTWNGTPRALMSYGPDRFALIRYAARYVKRLLSGERIPSHEKISSPNAFELAINLDSARGLGITVPESVKSDAKYLYSQPPDPLLPPPPPLD